MSRPRILLVEDEFLIRLTLAEGLSDAGFEVIEASDGDEALALLGAESRLDLLLTDVRLPGISGHSLVEQARRRFARLPVIVMSGQLEDTSALAAGGETLFIAKPYLPSEIAAAARRLLGSSASGSG